jgi:AcrR family transcriptional regulator
MGEKMKENLISRKEREYLRHRAEILQTAMNLFSEKGFHNVSMREIAEKSEFAVGTLYKFFSNKEDLYKSLIMEKAEEFHSALMKAIEKKGTEIEKIRGFIETLINLFMNNLNYVRLYLSVKWGTSFNLRINLDSDLKNLHEEVLQKLAKVFKKGTEKKIFKKIDPYLLAVALDSITSAFLFQNLENPDKHQFDANLIIDLFFNSVYEKEGPDNE